MSAAAPDLAERLTAFLASELPAASDVRISGLKRAGSGSSSENWLFDAEWRDQAGHHSCELVLRRAPKNEIVATAREDEFDLLTALERSPLPLPRAFWMDRDGRWLERPGMIVSRCKGRDDRLLLTDANSARLGVEARVSLARQLADLLADIHSVDIDSLDLPRRFKMRSPAAQLAEAAAASQAQEVEPCPELRLVRWWLKDNLPEASPKPVLVHGDFRPANVLVLGERITTILDWELAFVGDPLADLGWYLAPTYHSEHFIDGHWSEKDLLERYERAVGSTVDRAALRFWIVFAHYKLATIANAAMRAFLNGDPQRLATRPDRIYRPMLEMIADGNAHRRYA